MTTRGINYDVGTWSGPFLSRPVFDNGEPKSLFGGLAEYYRSRRRA